MKATSITQATNTMVELITQSLSEKIKETETHIHESLINGSIHTATQKIRKLSVWFEELIWKSFL